MLKIGGRGARLSVVVAAVVAVTSTAAPLQVLQSPDSALVTPRWTPVGVGGAIVTVMVQLGGDPVAVAQGNAGRKLSRSEKDQIKAALKGNQNAVRGSIQSLGGTVLADFQSAYNGMKVRVGRDKIDQLAALPGVVAVHAIAPKRPDNTNSVPFIGAPLVWQNLGLHGEGIKVAIIDTGIDYTHANFGGPGTPAAYAAAHAAETAPANPSLFGPNAPRVKGGVDLVGDTYNADPSDPAYQPVPHPDPNPLDCGGHGSHVAGTAAGSGVTSAGATYTGPYNLSTVPSHSWNVGPGVAPKADLYAIRVFGCAGSTDVVTDAIDWAVDHDMDVINMSLGSPFGTNDDPDAEATNNAVKAGVVVVASAGNEGPSNYILGTPSAADGAISVAANDGTASFPGATLTVNGISMTAIDANGAPIGGPYTLKVIKDSGGGSQSLGCSVADFGGPLPANTIAVVNRGTCARVAKAIFGQQAGAAAVVMVNNADGLPPYEGRITSNPDDGIPYNVTIPFLGVSGPATTATSDGAKLRAQADGSAVTVIGTTIANPGFTRFASFSSAGPRTADSSLKPDITAPGVSVFSTAVGSGNGGEYLSGTSMASPHVAGVAALTMQAHPTWNVRDIKAAILNTGVPSGVGDYQTSRGGTGLVQPASSTKSQVTARTSDDGKLGVTLNFGYQELSKNFSDKSTLKLRNDGSAPATFNVTQANAAGSPHAVAFNKSVVKVPAKGDAEVVVQLSVQAASAGDSTAFREVSGLVQLTPASSTDNGGVALRVPYYLVPRALSDVSTDLGKLKKGVDPATTATVTNKKGVIPGDADFYAWGLFAKKDKGHASNDVRAVGVQSFPNPSATDPDRQFMVFAVNTYDRWSNASTNEFDIYVDVDGDGTDDYVIVGVDDGAVQTGEFNGVFNAFVFSTRSGGASFLGAQAPTDSSTALLFVRSSQLCRPQEPCLSKTGNPRLAYHIVSFDIFGGGATKAVPGVAKFNPWSSAISQGGFATVAPGASASVPIQVNSAEWARTPAKGVMVVTFDNAAGDSEAELLDVNP